MPVLPLWIPQAMQPILSVPGSTGGGQAFGGGLDPLVFDLNGDGVIELASTVNSGVLFDYWGNDFAQGTGWLAAGANKDGMLAWDIDGFRSIKSCELSK